MSEAVFDAARDGVIDGAADHALRKGVAQVEGDIVRQVVARPPADVPDRCIDRVGAPRITVAAKHVGFEPPEWVLHDDISSEDIAGDEGVSVLAEANVAIGAFEADIPKIIARSRPERPAGRIGREPAVDADKHRKGEAAQNIRRGGELGRREIGGKDRAGKGEANRCDERTSDILHMLFSSFGW